MLLFCGTKVFDCLTCSLLIVVSVTDTNLCFPNCTCVVLCCCLNCCCGIRRSFDTQNVSVNILFMVETRRVVLVVNDVVISSVGLVVLGV